MERQKNYAPQLSFWDVFADAPSQPHKKLLDYPVSVISQLGDFYRLPSFRSHNYMVMNPDAIEHMLKTNRDNYTKVNAAYKRLEVGIGKCLLTASGDAWACKRKVIQPAFHTDYLHQYAEIMAHTTAEFLDGLRPLAEKESVLNLSSVMMKLGFFIATRTLFSMSFDTEAEKLIKSTDFLQDYATSWRTYLPVPHSLRYWWVMARMNRFSNSIIGAHHKLPRGDVVDLLLKARNEPHCGWQNFGGLQDEVRMLLVTGYETVGTNLSWLFFILSIRTEHWARLQEEVDSVLGQRLPTYDDLPNLHYSKMVIQECLRLFPSIMATGRVALADDVICGFDVPKGSNLMINFYGTHRNPLYWPEADVFDPERFSDENKRKQKKYTFVPFGAGPRACIASHYAMLEVQLIFAMVVQRFTFKDKSKKPIIPKPMVTIRPSKDIRSQIFLRAGIK